MDGERSFKNTFPDYYRIPLLGNDNKLHGSCIEKILPAIDRLLKILDDNAADDGKDYTIYTGAAGQALLHLYLHDKLPGVKDDRHLQQALTWLTPCLSRLKGGSRYSFLCGDAGPLALAAVVYHKLNDTKRAKSYIERVESMCSNVCADTDLPDEILYGRCGYLSSLFFLKHNIGQDCVRADKIQQVVEAVLKSGEKLARQGKYPIPLMYEWHDKVYLGAAHGLAGIFYMLLLSASICTNMAPTHQFHVRRNWCPAPQACVTLLSAFCCQSPATNQCDASSGVGGAGEPGQIKEPNLQRRIQSLVRPCIDYMLTLRFASGNCPSSLGSAGGDKLVQWCHGAPGWVHMFALAYKIFKDKQYLEAAKDCADACWQRGLLRKGYGICHGAGGNAYTFLTMFKLTGDERYLYYAYKFAEWCCDYGKHGCRTPDRPFSMFEGMAGTVYFLVDMLDPLSSAFPGFEFKD